MNLKQHIREHSRLGLKTAAPGFGQAIVQTSNGSRQFNFAANGSNERQKLVDLYQYFADELAAGRRVSSFLGAGDYGFDGNGLTQQFAVGSQGLCFSGVGPEATRFGYVGDTESGSEWSVLKFEPETDPVKSVTGITHVAGVATVNITDHGAVVGDTVRVYSSNQSEYNGLQVVTGVTDADNFTFTVDSGATTPATGTMTCAIHSEFLRDFAICNMQFIDTDPAAHASGLEETHGIIVNQCYGARFQNIWSYGIGDESIELLQVENFEISSFRSKNTPSQESTGGGVLSVKNGCHNGLIDKFIIGNIGSTSNNTYGVNLKNVVHPEKSSDIKIEHGLILNPVTAGFHLNTASANIHDIDINDVTVIGGVYGVTTSGAGNLLSNVTLDDFKAREQTTNNIHVDRALADVDNFTVQNSKLDGTLISTTEECVFVNGSNIKFIENHFLNGARALYSTDSADVVIRGGTMENCGGVGVNYPVVYDASSTKTMTVDNVNVIDAACNNLMFRGVNTIKNCPKLKSTGAPSTGIQSQAKYFDNNKEISHRLGDMTIANGSCSNNSFTLDAQPSATGLIRVHDVDGIQVLNNSSDQTSNPIVRLDNANQCIVTGNMAPAIASGNGIDEVDGAGDSDNNLIAFNQVNGATVATVGVVTAANVLSNI